MHDHMGHHVGGQHLTQALEPHKPPRERALLSTPPRPRARPVHRVTDDLRFYVDDGGRPIGPRTDDELREALRTGALDPDRRLRCADAPLWLPARAWATLAVESEAPSAPSAAELERASASPDLLCAATELLDCVLFFVLEDGAVRGPLPGAKIRPSVEGGRMRTAHLAPAGTADWVLARKLFDRTQSEARAVSAASSPDLPTMRCPTCLELVQATEELCPECEEPLDGSTAAPSTVRPGSIPDDPEGASFLAMHWRPLVAFGAIFGLLFVGVALRFLAPGRFAQEPPVTRMGAPAPACESSCWVGEACQVGECVWQKPVGAGHVPSKPSIAGPFELPSDVTDALLLDEERFAASALTGVRVQSTRTGRLLGLVSEAIQTRRLVRVGEVFYAVSPGHIAVVDVASTRLRKTLDLGAIVGDVTVGAGGRRALASLPGAHAVAVLSTELHAEIDRIRFGDDHVGVAVVDHSGERALAVTGQIPIAGLGDPKGGAVYAFDPSRLATEQDRVRAAMLGNPVDVLMSPDGVTSFVVLRSGSAVVPLAWERSGAVRQLEPIPTCDQPEELGIVAQRRRGVVRCARGRAVEIFDLETRQLLRHLPFHAPVADMVVSPDGAQLVVALPVGNEGAVGFVDLETYEIELVTLAAPPSRLRLSPEGSSLLVLSDRNKLAWVMR